MADKASHGAEPTGTLFFTRVKQDSDLATMSRFFRSAGDSDSDSESSEEELLSSGSDNEAGQQKTTTARPMSRFLRTEGGSDDDSDEDEDSDEESEDGEPEARPARSRFMVGQGDDDDDSDDEDGRRVVKSAKDKRTEEMEATGKVMENALKINDWVSITNGEPIYCLL